MDPSLLAEQTAKDGVGMLQPTTHHSLLQDR